MPLNAVGDCGLRATLFRKIPDGSTCSAPSAASAGGARFWRRTHDRRGIAMRLSEQKCPIEAGACSNEADYSGRLDGA